MTATPHNPHAWPEGKHPGTIDEFSQCLEASRILPADDCRRFIAAFRAGNQPQTPKALAIELIKAGILTRYQGQAILQGKIKFLSFGEYTILDKLGQGGMGQVLKAEHRRMKRTVALKVISNTAMKNAGAVQRFQREVRAAARLIHANIVTAFDASEHEGIHFLVMEYVDGKDLATLVHDEGPPPVEKAVDYVLQSARGLAYAHGKGIVHRDIKPGNLLVDGDGTVKILDMGLARIDLEIDASQELTNTGQVMGTVDYMAPEQAEDTHSADARADIYSLGCTLYRLVTGDVLYGGDTMMKKLLAHRGAPIPSLLEDASRLLPASEPLNRLDSIFRRMVAKRPDDRQQSMAQVVTELEMFLRGVAPPTPSSGSVDPTIDLKLEQFLSDMSSKSGKSSAAAAVNTEKKVVFAAEITQEFSAGDTSPSGIAPLAPPVAQTVKKPKAMPSRLAKHPLIVLAAAILFSIALAAAGIVIFLPTREIHSKSTASSAIAPKSPLMHDPAADHKGTSTSGLPAVGGAAGSSGEGNFALEFDGKSSHVDIPTLSWDGTPRFTLEAWVRAPQGGDSVVLQMRGSGICQIGRSQNDGHFKWVALMRGSGDSTFDWIAQPKETAFVNQSVHVALVVDGELARLFENGVQVAERAISTNRYTGLSKGGASIAGEPLAAGGWGWLFRATIDEVRFSKTARYSGEFKPQVRFEPDADTLALFHFDEGQGGLLTDSSGNGHHGKIVGAKWVSGIAAGPSPEPAAAARAQARMASSPALDLSPKIDSVSAYVKLLPLSARDPVTVEVYVTPRIAVEARQHRSVCFVADSLNLKQVGDNWVFNAGTGQGTVASVRQAGVVSGQRVHLAGVSTGKELRLFVDGKLAESKPLLLELATEPHDCYLGAKPGEYGPAWAPFDGTIDEVRISKTARFAADFTPPKAPFASDADTVALYHCDEGAGDVLTDSSGNGHHGKIVGAKWVTVDNAPSPQAPPAESAARTIDLLALVDLQRDAVSGKWRMTPDGLIAEPSEMPGAERAKRLQLPYTPPEEYDFEIEVTPEAPNFRTTQHFWAAGRSITWEYDSKSAGQIPYISGFSRLDGNQAQQSPESLKRDASLLTPGQRNRSRIEVRRGSLRVVLNDQEVTTWQGDLTRFSDSGLRDELPDPHRLGLISLQTTSIFHKITVREVTGRGTFADGVTPVSAASQK